MGVAIYGDSRLAIDKVRSALRGPVVQLLGAGIPAIRHMPPARAYDLLLGDLTLLEVSFDYFRKHRDQFKMVLIDDKRRPVEDDVTPLTCGRSLDQVVAMVVRSAAYRYFVKVLDGNRPIQRPLRRPKPSPLATLLMSVGISKPAPPPPKIRSKARDLYRAIRDHLLFEWQIPLVPTYSKLTPSQVTKLGARLTELKTANEVLAATGRPGVEAAAPLPSPISAGEPAAAAEAPAPKRLDLESLLNEDGRTLWVETLGLVLRDPEVVRAASNGEQPAHIRSALKSVCRDFLHCLVEDLQLDKKQLAVVLMRAQAVLPRTSFDQLVRGSINGAALIKFVMAAKRQKIGAQSSLQECADFITTQLTPKDAA